MDPEKNLAYCKIHDNTPIQYACTVIDCSTPLLCKECIKNHKILHRKHLCEFYELFKGNYRENFNEIMGLSEIIETKKKILISEFSHTIDKIFSFLKSLRKEAEVLFSRNNCKREFEFFKDQLDRFEINFDSNDNITLEVLKSRLNLHKYFQSLKERMLSHEDKNIGLISQLIDRKSVV